MEIDGVSYDVWISIHALLAESDKPMPLIKSCPGTFLSTLSLRRAAHYDNYNLHCVEISIHALLAESDYDTSSLMQCQTKFLSTLSLRRATYDTYAKVLRVNISIHALLAESDMIHPRSCNARSNFYPRSPCGERLLTLSMGVIPISFLSTLSLRRATSRTLI